MYDSIDDFDFGHEWDHAEQLAVEAYELYEKGRMEEAVEKLDNAIQVGPEHAEWYFNMALALDGAEQYERAVEYYQRALECSRDDVEILNCLGVDYTRTARYDLALSMFEKAETIDPSFEAIYCNRIITYTEMEKHDKAEQMFYIAQQINPDCPLCFYNIGNSLFTQGCYERALWCWEKCAELEPTHPQIYYRMAQVNWILGYAERATKEFLTEIRRAPGDLEVLMDFGLFLLESGDLEGAREKFNRILEYAPNHAAAYFYRGESLRIQGLIKPAVKSYYQAIEHDSHLVGPRFRIAEILMSGNQIKKAVELLRAECQLNVEDNDVLLAIGWMFLRAEQLTEAGNCFMQIFNDGNVDFRAFQGLAMSLILHGDYESALHCIDQALKIEPVRPELLLAAGWLCLKLDDLENAAVFTDKCNSAHRSQQPFRSRTNQLKRAIWLKKTRRTIQTRIRTLLGR
jgi:tetratricopeptide (TPR) repeat protein